MTSCMSAFKLLIGTSMNRTRFTDASLPKYFATFFLKFLQAWNMSNPFSIGSPSKFLHCSSLTNFVSVLQSSCTTLSTMMRACLSSSRISLIAVFSAWYAVSSSHRPPVPHIYVLCATMRPVDVHIAVTVAH